MNSKKKSVAKMITQILSDNDQSLFDMLHIFALIICSTSVANNIDKDKFNQILVKYSDLIQKSYSTINDKMGKV